jgi:hypothetical protein
MKRLFARSALLATWPCSSVAPLLAHAEDAGQR